MKLIKNVDFTTLWYEEKPLLPGFRMPDPYEGPYEFVDCTVHPRLWEACKQLYIPLGCKFTYTYIGPNA